MAACNNRSQWSETPALPSCLVFAGILSSSIYIICAVAGDPPKACVLQALSTADEKREGAVALL